MSLLHAVVLGIVQALGEFLPISSSAHLVLVPWLLKWSDPGLTFDIALHIGTLVAVVLYFWRDWLVLISHGLQRKRTREGRLFWYLVIATIPGGIAGVFLDDKAETVFRSPLLVAFFLIVMGALLYIVDRISLKTKNLEGLTLGNSILIGIAQALAIMPGVSRSGITITAGMLTGLKREEAARLSFLLSTPIIVGAGLVKLPEIIKQPSAMGVDFLVGTIAAAICGLLAIRFLLGYVQKHDYKVFVWYRFLLAALVITVWLVRR